MKTILRILALLLMAFVIPNASGTAVHLDKAPIALNDTASLQRGAKLFTSRCLACHSAAYMRYNRLRDIGMTEERVKKELELPEDVKPGSTMQAAMDANSARLAFGEPPPDLSVIARSRGADWLYTYMRTFYVDTARAGGWNNTTLPNVAMPFILADLQGKQVLRIENREGHEVKKLVLEEPGSMRPAEYDTAIADLVNYLVFMSDPSKMVRHELGYMVVGFLLVLFVLTYALKKEIWKDIR